MTFIKNITYTCLTVLFFIILQNNIVHAAAIDVSILVNGVVILPGPTKTVEVCYGGQFNLQVKNLKPPLSGSEIFEWKNLDSLKSFNGPQQNVSDAGRWVATIKYYNTTTATWTSASDTVHLVYATTSSLQITTTSGVAITSSNIYICGNSDTTFLASSGHTNYKWFKSSPSNLISSTNSLIMTTSLLSSSENTVSFFVTATNAFGCEVSAQKNIRRDNSFSVNLGPDIKQCSGTNVTLKSNPEPAGIIYSYNWNTGVNTKTITVNSTGIYWLRIASLGSKCSVTDSINVTFSNAPNIISTNDTTICSGTSAQLNASVLNGAGAYTYSWTPTAGLTDPNIQNPIATPINLGITAYTVSVVDPLGCGGGSASRTTNITLLNPYSNFYFSLNPGNDTSICFKSEATLNPKIIAPVYPATYTWKWSPSLGLSNTSIQNPIVSLTIPGSYKYIVDVTDDRGCKQKDSLFITNLFELTTTTNFTDTLSCVGTPIVLKATATGGSSSSYTYNFTPTQGGIFANQLTLALKDSSYTINVSAVDSEGCESPIVPVNLVGYKPYIQIASGTDTLGFGGNPLNLIANVKNKPSVTVIWYDSPTNAIIEYGLNYTSTIDESIYAEATDNLYNCTNRDSVNIEHRIEDLHALFIPNVFSPKASNTENQKLKVFGTLIQETDFNFRIYNQWGQLVYQTSSFIEANSLGWTGDIKGNNAQQSSNVYTYVVEGKFFDGVPFNKVGTATMLQ